MKKYLPYSRHWISKEDIKSVEGVLKSNWITQGPQVKEFEQRVAEYCGAKFSVAVSSGTAALHIAAIASEFNNGDEIITTPITFVATANCVLYCNAIPTFADIEPDTYNIDPEQIKKKINRRTKGIIPVDFAGQPCDIIEIKKIADENNLIIIQDAAQSLGSEYKDEEENWYKVGSCSHSHMTVLSFHPVKHITTGEGGMVLTNNEKLYQKLCMLRTHGITKDRKIMKNYEGPWYFEMQMLGFNYRITDFQCALGISQLKRIDELVNRRREIAQTYNKAFQNIDEIIIPYEAHNVKSSYHLYVIQVLEKKLKTNKREIFEYLLSKGLGLNVHHIPVHLHPFYKKKFGYKKGQLQVSENYYKKAISLPIYPTMSDRDIMYVIKVIQNTFLKYKKL